MPIAKSGRAEADLLERHPELAAMMDRERRAKVDSIILHNKYQDVEAWGPSSFRASSFDEAINSPLHQKQKRKSSREAGGLSPALKGRSAVLGLGASIEEDVTLDLGRPALKPGSSNLDQGSSRNTAIGTPTEAWLDSKDRPTSTYTATSVEEKQSGPLPSTATPSSSSKGAPWAATPSPGAKLEMRDIMAQASTSRVSNLSLGIAASRAQDASPQQPSAAPLAPSSFKVSQKERKRMMQTQQDHAAQIETQIASKTASPWQTVQKGGSLKDVVAIDSQQSSRSASPKAPAAQPAVIRPSATPQLSMRQTIANPKSQPTETKGNGHVAQSPIQQKRSVSGPVPSKATPPTKPAPSSHVQSRPSPTPLSQAQLPSASKPVKQKSQNLASQLAPSPPPDLSSQSFPNLIQSIRHSPLPSEPSLQLTMQEILNQQQLEKDIIKEAKEAKRNLQDIQAEQEFQEWWDREAARMREDEEFARLVAEGKDVPRGRDGGRGGKRGEKNAARGGHGGGGGEKAQTKGGQGSGRGGRGQGRGGGGAGRGRGGTSAAATASTPTRAKSEA